MGKENPFIKVNRYVGRSDMYTRVHEDARRKKGREEEYYREDIEEVLREREEKASKTGWSEEAQKRESLESVLKNIKGLDGQGLEFKEYINQYLRMFGSYLDQFEQEEERLKEYKWLMKVLRQMPEQSKNAKRALVYVD